MMEGAADPELIKSGELLAALRTARRRNDSEAYAQVLRDHKVRPLTRSGLTITSEAKECMCILSKGGQSNRYPGTTRQECAAAAANYGLTWEWECDE